MPKQQTVAKTVVDQLAEWGIDAVFGVVGDAAQDRVPLLVIAGRVESWYVGTNHKQYFDRLSLYRPFATYTAMLANPQSTVEVLTKAIKAALTRRMVSHISIPMDLFTTVSPAAIRPAEPYLHTHPASPPKVIDGVLPILNRSQRPVILAGRGTPGYRRAYCTR